MKEERVYSLERGGEDLAAVFTAGEQIGSYTILRHIGAGGMGEVYLAEHVHIGRKAAIKVLLPDLSSHADDIARFFAEARATGLVKHPSIVEVLDCAVHPSGAAYIVMEYLAGESLGAYLGRAGSLEEYPRIAAAIAGQIADALAAAHEKGIIHRDLKPDNVFLIPTPDAATPINVKILDFGIAKLVGKDTADVKKTKTGTLLGTPLYMSPEQCRGTGRVDYRTDIYSLGCMIFEAMSGRPPFVRDGVGDLIVAHISEEAPDLSLLVPSTPRALSQLVARMLAKAPTLRPPSMADVARTLAELLAVTSGGFLPLITLPEAFPIQVADDDSPSIARQPPTARTQTMPTPEHVTSPSFSRTQAIPVRPASANATVRATASAPSVTEPRRLPQRPKKRGLAVALLLLVVGLIGGGGLLYVRRSGHPPLSPSRPVAIENGAGTRPSQISDPAALASIAPFLQAGTEPPFPDGCRTTDVETLRGLANAARDLNPGAADAQRARGVAALQALPDKSAERWMIEARGTLAVDPKAAEHAGARAVSLCASSAVAENLHGNALQILQQVAPAESAYREAIRLAPTYLAPRFNLGLLRLQAGDARAALDIFNEIARANPDYPNIHLVRAEAQRRLGDRAAATADLEEQVKRQPDSGTGWLQLGRALRASDRRRAQAAFCRAKSLGEAAAIALCQR